MESMPSAAVERETPAPESGVREVVLDSGDAERELGEMGKRASEDAREVADDTAAETKGLTAEIPARYGEPMNAAESAQVAALDTRLVAARERMEQEVGAALSEKSEGPAADVKAAESRLREIDQQLEEAHRKGDGNKLRELEALRNQVDGERKKMMAEQAVAAKEAQTTPELTARDATPEEEAEVLEAAAETPRLALEARLRGLEGQLKDATGAEKNRLMGEMETATREWEAAAKEEGIEVTRPRDPADIRREVPQGEVANDNAKPAEVAPEAVVAAAVAVEAAAQAEEKPGKDGEKKKDDKKRPDGDSDDAGLKAYLQEEDRITEQLKALDAERAKAAQEREKMAEQKKAAELQAKKADVESGMAPGRAVGQAYQFVKESGILTFMEGAAEMVGAKKGSLESKLLQDLASRQEKYAETVKELKKKKEEIAEREAKLAAELAAIAQRRKELADVALSDPAWTELAKREDAAKKERVAIGDLEDEVQIGEAGAEEERLRLVEEEKKPAAATPEDGQKADENRDAMLPPEPPADGGPEKPEPPPEPPAAAKPPESAPPSPPAETKLAA